MVQEASQVVQPRSLLRQHQAFFSLLHPVNQFRTPAWQSKGSVVEVVVVVAVLVGVVDVVVVNVCDRVDVVTVEVFVGMETIVDVEFARVGVLVGVETGAVVFLGGMEVVPNIEFGLGIECEFVVFLADVEVPVKVVSIVPMAGAVVVGGQPPR
jgi:hypothetical protein